MTATTNSRATTRQYDLIRKLAARHGHGSPDEAAVAVGIRTSRKSLSKSGLTKQEASDLITALKENK